MYLTKKKFREKAYYYIVENKFIEGKPVMKHIMYLGSAEKILKIFKNLKKGS